jgi:two-component system chemotaxis response regulator CheB
LRLRTATLLWKTAWFASAGARGRTAIDPLFRTAARNYGPRVTGVIVSGQLDDGSAGLRAVRALGGYAIVQDPQEAIAGQMPASAIRYAGADLVLPAADIGPQLVHRVNGCTGAVMKKPDVRKAVESSEMPNLHAETPNDGEGVPSPFACPECGGVLWERKEDENVHFRCRVGHAYTINNLRQEQGDAIETALWAAMRALEEKAALETRLWGSLTDDRMIERLKEQAEADRDHAETIRRMLFEQEVGHDKKQTEEQSRSAD